MRTFRPKLEPQKRILPKQALLGYAKEKHLERAANRLGITVIELKRSVACRNDKACNALASAMNAQVGEAQGTDTFKGLRDYKHKATRL